MSNLQIPSQGTAPCADMDETLEVRDDKLLEKLREEIANNLIMIARLKAENELLEQDITQLSEELGIVPKKTQPLTSSTQCANTEI